MKKLSKKKADQIVNDMFKRLGNCAQFPIFDVPKVLRAAERVLLETGDEAKAEAAMKEAIEIYRVKS